MLNVDFAVGLQARQIWWDMHEIPFDKVVTRGRASQLLRKTILG